MKNQLMAPPVSLPVPTPDGVFTATYSHDGLVALAFPASGGRGSTSPPPEPWPPRLRLWHNTTQRAVRDVLRGVRPATLPPLDLSGGTPFQQEVWRVLRAIPPGHTRAYGEVAAALGRPRAGRAVGQACGANPIPLLIPCHRVLASGGRLGGFSGGLPWKKTLLSRERQPVADESR